MAPWEQRVKTRLHFRQNPHLKGLDGGKKTQ